MTPNKKQKPEDDPTLSAPKITAMSKLFDSFAKIAALAKGKEVKTGRPKNEKEEGDDSRKGDKDYMDELNKE